MAWKDLTQDSWVSRADLQDAVDEGIFLENNGVPVPDPNKWVTGDEAIDYVSLEEDQIPPQYLVTSPGRFLPKKYFIGQFPIELKDFEPLTSPFQILYAPEYDRVYFTDYDSMTSPLWYFNPNTAEDVDDFEYVPGFGPYTAGANINSRSFLYKDGYIYIQGDGSGGIIKVSCDTNTIVDSVSTGTDGNNSRYELFILGDNIWSYRRLGTPSPAFDIVDMDTMQIVDTLQPQVFGKNFTVHRLFNVKGNVWMTSSESHFYEYAQIHIYDDFSENTHFENDYIKEITFGETESYLGNGLVQVSLLHFDEEKDKVYIASYGDWKIYVYDPDNFSKLGEIDLSSKGKNSTVVNFIYRELTGQLFASCLCQSVSNDATAVNVTYEIDRDNIDLIPGELPVRITSIANDTDNNVMYSTIPGALNSGNKDGMIKVYN